MQLRLWSLLGFAAMAGSLVALFLDGSLLSLDPAVIAAQSAAVVLVIAGRHYLGLRSFHVGAEPTHGVLVTEGPYRLIRHPIYAGVCLFVWAAAVSRHTPPTFILAALVTIGAVTRMLCEEHLLAKHYPEYAEYARATKRIIPYVI
jgi:protein-S-isoprenylcysteine O-methyltransferase Ste14